MLIGKLVESTSMATTSLVSLVQLLDKVKNMVISDHIQKEVRFVFVLITKSFIVEIYSIPFGFFSWFTNTLFIYSIFMCFMCEQMVCTVYWPPNTLSGGCV